LNDLETDINSESRETSGGSMKKMEKIYRVLIPFVGGAVFILGVMYLLVYLFSTVKSTEILLFGLAIMAVSSLFTYFLGYRPQ